MTMTTLQTKDVCQSNDPNNLFPIESLRSPIENPIKVVFTGYYNGLSVEVRSMDEMELLQILGCYGKGTFSRSKPRSAQNEATPTIMRKRQFLKRNYWYKKFGTPRQHAEGDTFINEVDELTAKIIQDGEASNTKDVIDLVSSDEEMSDGPEEYLNETESFKENEEGDVVVIVPNSDSEDDDYFANLKPKCCLNKIKIEEKLMLTLPEAFFLLYSLSSLRIVVSGKELTVQAAWDMFSKADKNFRHKYVVYHYYKSKGYVVKPGIKFGGDYLLYKESPANVHADYIVLIKSGQEKMEWNSVFGHVRMAATTVKDIIITEVITPKEDYELPRDLHLYSVREILLNRKLPVVLN